VLIWAHMVCVTYPRIKFKFVVTDGSKNTLQVKVLQQAVGSNVR